MLDSAISSKLFSLSEKSFSLSIVTTGGNRSTQRKPTVFQSQTENTHYSQLYIHLGIILLRILKHQKSSN